MKVGAHSRTCMVASGNTRLIIALIGAQHRVGEQRTCARKRAMLQRNRPRWKHTCMVGADIRCSGEGVPARKTQERRSRMRPGTMSA